MEQSRRSRPGPGVIRAAGLGIGFAATLVGGSAWLGRCAPEPADLDGLKPAIFLERSLASSEDLRRDPELTWICFLGDSTTMQRPGRRNPAGSTIRSLRQRAPERRFHATIVASPGLAVFGYYALADRLASEEPDAVVLALNLSTFAEEPRQWPRPELAGWIEARRWPATLGLPLQWEDLTTDELLTYRALVRLGLAETWYALRYQQRRLARAWEAIGHGGDALLGFETEVALRRLATARQIERFTLQGEGKRPSYVGAEHLYGPVMRGLSRSSPWVGLWARTVERYAASGTRVLVFVVPVNVEHFERHGIPLGPGLARSLDLLQEVVEEAGGEWVDLHALLPDAVFRDSQHFNEAGSGHPGSAVGEALAERLLAPAREGD